MIAVDRINDIKTPRILIRGVSFVKYAQHFYLHLMDFYKLTNFQLYSIINSRHLDKDSKEAAVREFNRRGLTDEEIEKLADELADKNKVSSFAMGPNIILLILAVVILFLLKQCTYR